MTDSSYPPAYQNDDEVVNMTVMQDNNYLVKAKNRTYSINQIVNYFEETLLRSNFNIPEKICFKICDFKRRAMFWFVIISIWKIK